MLHCVLLEHDENLVNIFCVIERRDMLSIDLVPGDFNAAIGLLLSHEELWMLVLPLDHNLLKILVHNLTFFR